MTEVEVFRYCESDFDKNKVYDYALYTRSVNPWPNTKYYTTNKLQYVGKYLRTESWGMGDASGCASYFDNNGEIIRIEYDYDGKTCFREHTDELQK